MKQIELIPEIKRLCVLCEFDKAIALTNKIQNKVIAIKAHILCIESEKNFLKRNENGNLN